jgi:TM2 domain-containing membrane protein YozV
MVCSASYTKASTSAENTLVSIIITDTVLKTTDTIHTASLRIATDSTFSPTHNTELKKKIVAALFAFPFPFGFMGAHRVMLGTKPWVPIVYAATFGGCFGIIPLIDFCVIVFSKDIKQYENNPHVFMWVK